MRVSTPAARRRVADKENWIVLADCRAQRLEAGFIASGKLSERSQRLPAAV